MVIPTKPFFVEENEALKKKVERLEEEADWLASQLAMFDTCPNEMLEEDVDCFLRCKRNMYTKPCWLAYAKEAVKDASNNS